MIDRKEFAQGLAASKSVGTLVMPQSHSSSFDSISDPIRYVTALADTPVQDLSTITTLKLCFHSLGGVLIVAV